MSKYITVACTRLFTLESDHLISEKEALFRLNSDTEHEQPIEFLENLFFKFALVEYISTAIRERVHISEDSQQISPHNIKRNVCLHLHLPK